MSWPFPPRPDEAPQSAGGAHELFEIERARLTGQPVTVVRWAVPAVLPQDSLEIALLLLRARDADWQQMQDLLRQVDAELQRRRAEADPRRAQGQEFIATMLMLGRLQLADAMTKAKQPAAAARAEIQSALDLGVRSVMVYALAVYARHLLDQAEWDAAAVALDRSVDFGQRENEAPRRSGNRATVADARATRQLGEGAFFDAERTLRTALDEAASSQARDYGWEGKLLDTLATCLVRQDRAQEAIAILAQGADCYRQSGDRGSASVLHTRRGDLLTEHRDDAAARTAYADALRVAGSDLVAVNPAPADAVPADATRDQAALLRARMGLLDVHLGAADTELRLSVEAIPDHVWRNPYDRLVRRELSDILEQRSDLRATLRVWLCRVLADARDGATPNPLTRRDTVYALRSLFDIGLARAGTDLDRPWPDPEPPSSPAPIAVEIARPLLHGVEDADEPVKEAMGSMRQRLRAAFGVIIPGVVVRASDERTTGATLRIYEIVGGSLAVTTPGTAAFGATADALVQALPAHFASLIGHQEVRNLMAAENPSDGAPPVPPRDLRAFVRAWMIERTALLARVLHAVQKLIGYPAAQTPAAPDNPPPDTALVSVQRFSELVRMESYEHMAPLTRLVRTLAAERVPITDFAHLHATFMDGQPTAAGTSAVADRLRGQGAPWGSEPHRRPLLVPGALIPLLGDPADAPIAIERTALTALGARVAELDPLACVLVVDTHTQRPLARAMLDLLGRGLPVVALAELPPDLLARLEDLP